MTKKKTIKLINEIVGLCLAKREGGIAIGNLQAVLLGARLNKAKEQRVREDQEQRIREDQDGVKWRLVELEGKVRALVDLVATAGKVTTGNDWMLHGMIKELSARLDALEAKRRPAKTKAGRAR